MKKQELIEENKKLKKTIEKYKNCSKWGKGDFRTYTNKERTIGIGSAKIEGILIKSKYSIELLENAFKIIKKLGNDTANVIISEDWPIGIGNYDEETKLFSGVFVAPRMDDEND